MKKPGATSSAGEFARPASPEDAPEPEVPPTSASSNGSLNVLRHVVGEGEADANMMKLVRLAEDAIGAWLPLVVSRSWHNNRKVVPTQRPHHFQFLSHCNI